MQLSNTRIEENQMMHQQENRDLQNQLDKVRAENAALLKEPCRNQGCGQIREDLKRHVKELQNAFSLVGCEHLYSGYIL